MKINYRKLLGVLLLSIGIIGLSANFLIGYIGEKKNKDMMESFEWEQAGDDSTIDLGEVSYDNKQNTFRDNIIAIVSIPKVNIKYPVANNTKVETLKKALGHYENTALPGEKGNFAVAGHRNSSHAKYFNRLDEVKKGDEIIVETRNEKYTYIVTNTFKVHETQTDILKQSKNEMITLVTCTNGYKPEYRIVVQGILK